MSSQRYRPEIDAELAAQETVRIERTLIASPDQSDQSKLPKTRVNVNTYSFDDDNINSDEEGNVTTDRFYDSNAISSQRYIPEMDAELAAKQTVRVECILTASPDQSNQPDLPNPDDDTISSDEEVMRSVPTPAISSTSMNSMVLDVDLPPEPTGACSEDLLRKIEELTRLMNLSNCDINQIITSKKMYKNPATYENLVNQFQINEYGTNLDPRVYDPLKWDKTSYYDELAKVQNMTMKQRQEEKSVNPDDKLLDGPVKKIANAAAVAKRDKTKRKLTCDNTDSCTPTNDPTVTDI